MDEPTLNDIQELLGELKKELHELNRAFFASSINKKVKMRGLIEYMWSTIHTFRVHFEMSDQEPYHSIQKMAGQLSRMRNLIMHQEFDQGHMEKEFLVLRRFVYQFEKNLVRKKYFDETGIWPEQVGSISWAAKLTGKSEVTIRRYIFAEKIKAYKVTKQWLIPYEEIQRFKEND